VSPPFLTVIVPTQGRDTLGRMLSSIRAQREARDVEVLVVEDTHGSVNSDVARQAATYDARHLTHDAGHHCWGHCQINAALLKATGDYVAFQDDDDIYTLGTFDAIQHAAATLDELRPMMFQFRDYFGRVLWDEPKAILTRVGGHCIITPNVTSRLGRWGCRYEGDYDFIVQTLRHYAPCQVSWISRVITVARPEEQEEGVAC
jgi:glycosyltransferase involved in cell wall biosynthesis